MKVLLGATALLSLLFPRFAKADADKPLVAVALVAEKQDINADIRSALGKTGYSMRDVSVEYDTFNGLSMLNTGNLDSPRPGFWPRDLNSLWDQGIQACKLRAGGPPYGIKNSSAFLCGRDLAMALWQIWLEHEKLENVVVVEVKRIEKKDSFDLKAEIFSPNETAKRFMVRADLSGSSIGAQAGEIVLKLLDGEGKVERREIVRELPAPPSEDSPELMEGEAQDFPPVPLPAGCKAPLPQMLSVEPAKAPLAITIVRRWKRSVTGMNTSGPALSCQLLLSTSTSGIMGTSMRSIEGTLQCGELRLVAHAPSTSAGKPLSQDKISQKFITDLVKHFCKQ